MFHFLVLLNSSFANLRKRTENCEYTSDDKKFTIIYIQHGRESDALPSRIETEA